MCRVGMHQPYLFPYRGYFDLIASVDKFVLFDDAQYMKGGYINRNYFPDLFTFRLTRHSNYDRINQCYFYDIEDDMARFRRKFGTLADGYLWLLEQDDDIATNIGRTVRLICSDLGITTPIYEASAIPHGKFVEGILDVVNYLGGTTYVNAPGGRHLYNQEMFGDVKLEFIDTVPGPSILCSEELRERSSVHICV